MLAASSLRGMGGEGGREGGRQNRRKEGKEKPRACLLVTVKWSLTRPSSLPLPTAPPAGCLWSPVRIHAQLPTFLGSAIRSVGGHFLSWAVQCSAWGIENILLGRWACSDALTVVSALTGNIYHAGPLCQHKSMVTCSKGCNQQTECWGLNRWYFWNM